ncbi:MAG: hypothetical protein ABID38_07395 [Candidatus Diapherotrites archaeon]
MDWKEFFRPNREKIILSALIIVLANVLFLVSYTDLCREPAYGACVILSLSSMLIINFVFFIFWVLSTIILNILLFSFKIDLFSYLYFSSPLNLGLFIVFSIFSAYLWSCILYNRKRLKMAIALAIGTLLVLHFLSPFIYGNEFDRGLPLKYLVNGVCPPPASNLATLFPCPNPDFIAFFVDLIIILAVSYGFVYWRTRK